MYASVSQTLPEHCVLSLSMYNLYLKPYLSSVFVVSSCSQAIAACLATYLADVLTAGNRLGTKVSSLVDKVQPFTRADILLKKGKSRRKVICRTSIHVCSIDN